MTARLILTDIDGTILPTGHSRVSEHTVAAVHAARDAGLLVGPASGRAFAFIPDFFGGDASCCATALATNGMQVYVDGEKVMEQTLDRAALERVREIVAQTPRAGLVCFDGSRPLLAAGAREDLLRAFRSYGERCTVTGELPDFDVVKANVFSGGEEAEMAELVARLGEEVPELDVDRAMPTYSNIMPHGWNKGTAARWLAERLGVAPEEVVAFGDADNDLPMFAAIPNSVAVAGATPEAAAAARWHIGACEDDAVAAAIEALARGEWPFER